MGDFGKRLKRYRTERGMASKDLARAVGVTPAMVSRWERKGVVPSSTTIQKIAATLKVDLELLLPQPDLARHTGTGEVPASDNAEDFDRDITRGYKKHDVPVVGDAEATANGIIAWSDEGIVRGQVDHWVSRAFSDGDPKAYALRIRGDSMVPRYYQGEIVIAQPRITPKDGDFACVQLKNGERLVKRVFRSAGGWVLRSLNEAYPPREVSNDDVHAVHVIKHSIARM